MNQRVTVGPLNSPRDVQKAIQTLQRAVNEIGEVATPDDIAGLQAQINDLKSEIAAMRSEGV